MSVYGSVERIRQVVSQDPPNVVLLKAVESFITAAQEPPRDIDKVRHELREVVCRAVGVPPA